MPDTGVLDAALGASGRGWSVVPMHSMVRGRCTCGAPMCASPGKHPRVRWDEFQRRRATDDEVRRWWRRWPEANLGVVTGAVSGLVVVDVDPRTGGDEALVDLEGRFGALPDTVECLTGGGGLHLYLRHPGGSVLSGPFAPGVDVKGDGGLVVAPPSVHQSGVRYRWESGASPDEHQLADAPAWIVDAPERDGDPIRQRRVFAPRTSEERREFARLWDRLGVHIEPGDRYYLCPLHDDHHPSLHIDADGCRWYCFGCCRGGGPGRLRRIAARQGRDPRSVPALDRGERAGPSATAKASVPSTWMQWPALQPGGTQAVVGEANCADTLERLAGGRTWSGPRTRWVTARLVREHTNPHDPGAVRVEIGGETVGYLPREDAPRFHSILDELARAQEPATARARLTGGWERGPYGRGSIGVILDTDPRLRRRPPDCPFLPAELTLHVRVEAQHHAALRQLLGDATSVNVTATLRVPREDRPHVMGVCVADDEIGILTERTTARYLTLVRQAIAARFPATCAAMVERGKRGPTLRVRLPRPNEN